MLTRRLPKSLSPRELQRGNFGHMSSLLKRYVPCTTLIALSKLLFALETPAKPLHLNSRFGQRLIFTYTGTAKWFSLPCRTPPPSALTLPPALNLTCACHNGHGRR